MQGAVFRGGGDYPGNEFIIGSGRDGLLCRYFSGRRHLDPIDQITLEFAGAYRHYHACLMRTIPVGEARTFRLSGAGAQLSNDGGTISLLDANGLKVDGVAYTKADAARQGAALAF